MTKVLFICHGNICRSTMAEMVFRHMVCRRNLSHVFYVDSAATSREEIGNRVHEGTRRKLAQEGIPCLDHRARQVTRQDYDDFDYMIVMDDNNIRNLKRIINTDPEKKIHKLLDFTVRKGASIADPWYTGDFDLTYRDVLEGCEGLLDYLVENGSVY